MNPSGSLKLTFDDTFTTFSASPSGNGTTWKTTLPHGLRTIAGTGEREYYSDASVGTDPFSDSNGVLSITAAPGSNPLGLPYTSGVITTENSFAQLYGYFQITAELPSGQGMWPAFWLLPADLQGTQEIEAMESFGTHAGQDAVAVHAPSTGVEDVASQTSNLSNHYNTYGVYWTPTTISFYFDGRQVAVAPTPADMNTPMFMLANLAVAPNVASNTEAPATLKIADISAYAYDPSVPGPTAPLHVNVPATATGTQGGVIALAGAAIADSNSYAAKTISVTISDKSLGMLWIAPTAGVTITQSDSWEVKFSGSLASVNAALATLSYKNEPIPSGSAPTSDTITIAASDAAGDMDSQRITVALTQAASPSFIALGAAPERVVASGNDVFELTKGAIADPHTNNGIGEQIVDFHAAAASVSGSDFIAFHGFAPGAQLVFDHDAKAHGVVDASMQYYRVVDGHGGSPLIFVQMANGSSAHLTAADYGFYPS